MKLKQVGGRVAKVAEKLGGEAVLAELASLSTSQIYRYIRGESQPGIDAIEKIANAGNVAIEWLISGKGDMDSGGPLVYGINDPSFNRRVDALREARELRYPVGQAEVPKGQSFMHMEGDSMEPTLADGELVVVDTSHSNPSRISEGIYFFTLNDQTFTRRLQRMPKKRLRAIADNKSYEPFEISVSGDQHFSLIGKALWASGWRRV